MLERQRPGKKEDDQHIKTIHHCVVPMPLDGDVVRVDRAAKEFQVSEIGNRIYLVEGVQIHSAGVGGEHPVSGKLRDEIALTSSPLPGTADSFAQMVEAVKEGDVSTVVHL